MIMESNPQAPQIKLLRPSTTKNEKLSFEFFICVIKNFFPFMLKCKFSGKKILSLDI